MVERAVRVSERPIRGSGCQQKGLRGRLEDLGASHRVWEASQGVTRSVTFMGLKHEQFMLELV